MGVTVVSGRKADDLADARTDRIGVAGNLFITFGKPFDEWREMRWLRVAETVAAIPQSLILPCFRSPDEPSARQHHVPIHLF